MEHVESAAADTPPTDEHTNAATGGAFDQIMAAKDLGESTIEIQEWGMSFRVRGLTRAEVMRMRREARDEQGELDPEKIDLFFLTHAVVEPALTGEQWQQIVAAKGSRAIETLTNRALEESALLPGFRPPQGG